MEIIPGEWSVGKLRSKKTTLLGKSEIKREISAS
jgi:hypothetical protein